MFGWRKKTDGFEWREYVRTTIKIRREDRAKKIDEIKQAAAEGAKAAGRKGVAAGQSGAKGLSNGLLASLRWICASISTGIRRGSLGIGTAVTGAARKIAGVRLSNVSSTIAAISTRAKIAAMFGVLGLLAGTSSYLQFRQAGTDWSALLAALVAIALLGFAIAPWCNQLWQALTGRLQSASNLSQTFSIKSIGAIPTVLIAGAVGVWGWQSGTISSTSNSLISKLPSAPSMSFSNNLPDITGSGRAISGDTIRIRKQTIRLAGIEAPEISQVCRDKRNRTWSCGRRSRSTLRRLVRRKKIVCKNVSQAAGNHVQGTCRIGQQDLASELVKKGYAFAAGTVFKTYAANEDMAREAKRGIWQGKAQRPKDFRATRWKLASKSAPDGCPIKGRVVRKIKVYVLPWALDYRQVRVRLRRGERWFCSEEEATSAGFKPSSTG